MDNAAGAPGIPIEDALYVANLLHQANPEEISLDKTLADTPELVEEDSPSREVLSKIAAVRNHIKEGATPRQPDPKKIKANQDVGESSKPKTRRRKIKKNGPETKNC